MKTIKHDHLLTKLLKVSIFSLMMLLPFMIWLPNGFYYGFNETAVAQEKTEQVPVYYESNEVNTYSDLIVDKIYHWTGNIESLPPLTTASPVFSIKKTDNLSWLLNFNDLTFLRISRTSNNNAYLVIGYTGWSTWVLINDISFDFVYDNSLNTNYIEVLLPYITESTFKLPTGETTPITTNMSITDSMSYAWQSVWDNNLMSWTNNSILKTPIDNFIGVFAINNDACISNYLIYLMTLTGIYVVIDIVLELFIALTHMFSRETK